ncbi:hypothetical protein [Salinimicrobium sp. HB62]|uniref:hypothetical protein n=1 Tax=Salinimicrobium sp. HB62 TaxID=3077781 RepID=UPI002D7946C1|nr:hypothetical protein [Salinimicrobium sp. HB62]
MFKNLHREFENKATDLFELQTKDNFSRYLLIRSLDRDHLKELIEKHTGEEVNKGKFEDFYEKLFDSKITNEEIIEYIKTEYPKVKESRKEQEEYLPDIIKDFGEVKCGIRNDNLNDTAKELVRDKTIKDKNDLEEKIDDLLENRIKGYLLWQYYNQVTNDLIEHIFNDHPNVIPTLRKIKFVDFLVQKGDKIIPFDLKITHISDDYFDLHKKGIIDSPEESHDSFSIEDNPSEQEIIKEKYKEYKRDLDLPNYGGLSKIEMLEILAEQNDELKNFVEDITKERNKMIEEIEENLLPVEWWNYKFQGERLFKNNNRFFVFLAFKNSFEDARPLKGRLELIEEKVKEKLDSIIKDDINTIKYYYSKDRGLEGAYKINSVSILVTE